MFDSLRWHNMKHKHTRATWILFETNKALCFVEHNSIENESLYNNDFFLDGASPRHIQCEVNYYLESSTLASIYDFHTRYMSYYEK